MNHPILLPIFAMVVLTFTVLGVMFWTRVQALKKQTLRYSYFSTYTGDSPSEQIIKTSRHYINLFELPVIFYVTSLIIIFLKLENSWNLAWAWSFVIARVLHAIIHLGKNNITHRLYTYVIGCISIIMLWIGIFKAI